MSLADRYELVALCLFNELGQKCPAWKSWKDEAGIRAYQDYPLKGDGQEFMFGIELPTGKVFGFMHADLWQHCHLPAVERALWSNQQNQSSAVKQYLFTIQGKQSMSKNTQRITSQRFEAQIRSQIQGMTPTEVTDFLTSRIAAIEEDTLHLGCTPHDAMRLDILASILKSSTKSAPANPPATPSNKRDSVPFG